jgi:hypothetical protein
MHLPVVQEADRHAAGGGRAIFERIELFCLGIFPQRVGACAYDRRHRPEQTEVSQCIHLIQGGAMRTRIVIVGLFVIGLFSATGFSSNGLHTSTRQWAVVKLSEPVALSGHILMGNYLVVHDDARMAKGEPCTSIYRFDPARGPKELEIEFMCQPHQRALCDKTTFSVRRDAALGINYVTEYQFAGDPEAHGIPTR